MEIWALFFWRSLADKHSDTLFTRIPVVESFKASPETNASFPLLANFGAMKRIPLRYGKAVELFPSDVFSIAKDGYM